MFIYLLLEAKRAILLCRMCVASSPRVVCVTHFQSNAGALANIPLGGQIHIYLWCVCGCGSALRDLSMEEWRSGWFKFYTLCGLKFGVENFSLRKGRGGGNCCKRFMYSPARFACVCLRVFWEQSPKVGIWFSAVDLNMNIIFGAVNEKLT